MASEALPILFADTTDQGVYHAAVWDRVFNPRRDESRIPHAVVKVSTVDHIIAAIKLAKKDDRRVSIRSGGHSWAVWSVRHGAILLDLGGLKHLEYDEQSQIVSCSPSTTSEQLIDFLSPKGRMFGTGHCGEVGLGGFLLGGGQGWNAKIWRGYKIIGSQATPTSVLMLKHGEQVHCNIKENEDLFWLARGGGPAFPGVITKFYLQTRPLKSVFHSTFAWPITEWSRVMPWATTVADEFDVDSEVACVAGFPPGSPVPALLVLFISFKDSAEEAEAAMLSVKENHPPGALLEQICKPSTFASEFAFQTFASPPEHQYVVDNAWISDDADVVSVLEKTAQSVPNKTSLLLYMPMTSSQRPINGDTAFSMHSKHYVSLYAGWKDEKDEDPSTSWVNAGITAMLPHSIGSMVSDFDFQRREGKLWEKEKGGKIMTLRRKWDPEGRFAGFLDTEDASGVASSTNKFA